MSSGGYHDAPLAPVGCSASLGGRPSAAGGVDRPSAVAPVHRVAHHLMRGRDPDSLAHPRRRRRPRDALANAPAHARCTDPRDPNDFAFDLQCVST
jgi:hypothetical protein